MWLFPGQPKRDLIAVGRLHLDIQKDGVIGHRLRGAVEIRSGGESVHLNAGVIFRQKRSQMRKGLGFIVTDCDLHASASFS